jgi:Uma2 family endonuclease
MPTLTIALPPQGRQTEANLRRWDELLEDPSLATFEGRVETDRHGQVIMSPPPSAHHGRFETRIARLLDEHMLTGEAIVECPISTADGVKAADVVWASDASLRDLGNRSCFKRAPEICIEVLSPRNSKAEIAEKVALYFDAGAIEVWICDGSAQMSFFHKANAPAAKKSKLCPAFPKAISLR